MCFYVILYILGILDLILKECVGGYFCVIKYDYIGWFFEVV